VAKSRVSSVDKVEISYRILAKLTNHCGKIATGTGRRDENPCEQPASAERTKLPRIAHRMVAPLRAVASIRGDASRSLNVTEY
jgi:hypothetical protein